MPRKRRENSGRIDPEVVKDLEKQIAELTQQGSAYWQNQHPNHKQAVDEVFKLREILHN